MVRLLLDTHAFLWWIDDAPQLPAPARAAIGNANNECYVSLASCWEMALKISLGRLRLARPLERFVSEQLAANRFTLLNIDLRHVAKAEKMPFHHRERPIRPLSNRSGNGRKADDCNGRQRFRRIRH